MEINKKTRFLIVGLGLLGGSYARGMTQKGYTVDAFVRSESTARYAREHGLCRDVYTYVDRDAVAGADVIIFALYPHVFVRWIEENGSLITPGTIVTDVTGVKGCIVDKIQSLLPEGVEFVSAHPMAGREVYGVENSDETIFYGANYVVVPTEKNTEEGIEACMRIGEILGFGRIARLSPKQHDEMIGFVSQLTHCIAVSLMTCYDHERLEEYTGDSFRDLTRIANINEKMWAELFLLNRDALLRQMELFETQFDMLKEYIRSGDAEGMKEMMRTSSERRRAFDK